MARAEVNPSLYASSHSNLSHLSSPLPKRSRLSLRRTTQYLHKPCYREDDYTDTKPETKTEIKSEIENVEMIDLTRDENKSPNCNNSSIDMKTEPSLTAEEEENKIKVWTIGLPNCGNTCYVNSILQVLRYTPEFLNSLHALLLTQHHMSKAVLNDNETKEIAFFKQMHLLFSAMKRKEALMRVNIDKDYCSFLLRPVKLVINSLREVCVLFEEGEQHDAHEFLITTISAFSTACQSLQGQFSNIEKIGEQDTSSVKSSDIGPSSICDEVSPAGQDIKKQMNSAKRRKLKNVAFDFSGLDSLSLGFEGKIRHIVMCLECENRLEREENFANLEINIPETISGEDAVDLRECLSQTTMLCGENKYYCEECLRYNEARMSSEVVTLPPVLLLHFSWLRSSSEVSNVEKSNIKIMIPQSLETSDNSDIFCRTPDQNYKLYAVVLHIGRSTEGGHYVSFVKDSSQSSDTENCEPQTLKPKPRTSQFTSAAELCCTTQEITNFKTIDSPSKWLLFDDNVVSPVCIDEDSDSFPYFNYLSITASPCMIFYHKT